MFAIGIAVVLVVAAIGGVAARVMMGPEETALLRLARAAPAQRRLVASAAQQERDARAATAQRPPRGRSSPAGAESASRSSPAPPRGVLDALPQAPIRIRTRGAALTASRHTHHSTRNTGRERLSGSRIICARGRASRRTPGSGSEWPGDVRFDPFATDLMARRRPPLGATSGLTHGSKNVFYSSTWSARASSGGGTSRPSVLRVLGLVRARR